MVALLGDKFRKRLTCKFNLDMIIDKAIYEHSESSVNASSFSSSFKDGMATC